MSSQKPSQIEEEYFAREEAEKKRRLALDQVKTMAQAERDTQRALHHMHCPKCGMLMQEIALQGVLVDKCFSCNGVFFDDGELEKIIGKQGYWANMLKFFARKDYQNG